MKTKQLIDSIRWMIRADYDDVLAIDDCGYATPWDETDFLKVLRKKSSIGVVLTDALNRAIGFCIYELQKTQIKVLRMAVAPKWRRKRIATAMIDRLKDRVCHAHPDGIVAEVEGHSLFAQHCLHDNGFTAHPLKDDRILFLWERGQ